MRPRPKLHSSPSWLGGRDFPHPDTSPGHSYHLTGMDIVLPTHYEISHMREKLDKKGEKKVNRDSPQLTLPVTH